MAATDAASSSIRTSREALADLRPVHGRVQDVAGLAAGAAHERRADALVDVLGDGGGALGRLVVGVGVDAEEAEGLGHRRATVPGLGPSPAPRIDPGRGRTPPTSEGVVSGCWRGAGVSISPTPYAAALWTGPGSAVDFRKWIPAPVRGASAVR